MLPRILSIAAPVWVYVTMAILAAGLWRQRRNLEWLAIAPSLAGLAASFLFLPPAHRLFFDEDIYINLASNLAHAPVAQLTLQGNPDDVQVSTYYKEPVGWPVLLSLVFLVTGRSEAVAFVAARIVFALAIAAVYHLARGAALSRIQAVVAAGVFGAAPACFWFSVSAGTDLPAALMAILGMWGLISANGALAAGGLAMAAQTRMELLILLPLIWMFVKIPRAWKLASAALVLVEAAHVGWVTYVSPVLARAENVPAAFGLAYAPGNLWDNVLYLFNPIAFAAAATVLALIAARRRRLGPLQSQMVLLFAVYLLFYAGSFRINQRYSIQILAPLAILAASTIKRSAWITALAASLALPYLQPSQFTGYLEALAADHALAVQFARRAGPNDLVVSAAPQVFMNQGVRAIDASFASSRKEKLEEDMRSRARTWYHEGARANRLDSVEAEADRWMKSTFELHLIDSREIGGMRIAFYEVLAK